MEFVGIDNVSGCLLIYLNDLTLEVYSSGIVCQNVDYCHWTFISLFKYNEQEENYDFFQYRNELRSVYKMNFGL